MKSTTLVLGASENTSRYSNMAIRSLVSHGRKVVAIGLKSGRVGDVEILTGQPSLTDIDTVTLYLSAANQLPVLNYILSLEPRRIIFNPGAENPELVALASSKGIECLEACTLVMLSTGQY